MHAGEYQRWESTAGDIPLRLFARASLAEYVHAEHWFVPTRQGFEFFQTYFEIPYPFGKYDQVIVPHFNSGAMENVGAVTFSERFLSRGTVTRQARRSLASVILHEMAHMWFGDLVTMDWWNGLWLNESFATFMATLAMVEATEFTEDRLGAYRGSVGAYRADERDTTHAIEVPIPNTDAAIANFDAITYSKGSATLTQLNHLVGPEAFRRGVAAISEGTCLRQHDDRRLSCGHRPGGRPESRRLGRRLASTTGRQRRCGGVRLHRGYGRGYGGAAERANRVADPAHASHAIGSLQLRRG